MAPPPPSDSDDYFPLRWESTGDQWWYASPIDLAAANGLYDLVVELLHLDTNLLIKLTSLRRIRRLESVWDDDHNENYPHFQNVAKCRSHVARNLMLECDHNNKENSLIRAGYGGWLLYTAASAGDVDFVKELLRRDPLLVFGEGEYGVTDMLYAAARGSSCEVFRMLLDSAMLPSGGEELVVDDENGDEVFKRDMMNRAVHAAARGGNWEILKELLGGSDSYGILGHRDAQGCTVLHTAAGRGKVQVVRNLLSSFDIIDSKDAQGNTALHVASYRGNLSVVETLILSSPSLAFLTNQYGDTFLHMAVSGFKSPGFSRLNKHIELMKELVSGKIINIKDIINIRNNDGLTAFHVSVIDNIIQCELVELLMSVKTIDLNIIDANGMTPLDHLRQRSPSPSSEILIKRLVSDGGMSNHKDIPVARNSIFSYTKTHSIIGGSPGTSFRIPDAEIFLYTGIENSSDVNYDQASVESINSCSSEQSNADSADSPCYNNNSIKSNNTVNHAASRLKLLLQWPRRKETKESASQLGDEDSSDPFSSSRNSEEFPISLRQRYSKPCSLPNNRRTQPIRTSLFPSPSSKSKMNFSSGLMQGVIQVKPHVPLQSSAHSITSPFQELSLSSIYKQKGADTFRRSNRSIDDGDVLHLNCSKGSFNKKLMNRYFSFGAQGLAVEDSRPNRSHKRFSSIVA